ncbi:phosphonate C-P lyase system protein PhnG [Escherichia coli]
MNSLWSTECTQIPRPASTGCPYWRTSQPAELAARLNALNITADYEVIRTAETGLVQRVRMGGTGERFFAGDATLTARRTPD